MGQFSMEKPSLTGSVLSGNQHYDHQTAHQPLLVTRKTFSCVDRGPIVLDDEVADSPIMHKNVRRLLRHIGKFVEDVLTFPMRHAYNPHGDKP